VAATINDLRETLSVVNAAREGAKLGGLVMVNSIEPHGIVFMSASGGGTLKPAHDGSFEKRDQAMAFLAGQLDILQSL